MKEDAETHRAAAQGFIPIALGAALFVGACSSARTDQPGTVPVPDGLLVRTEQIYYDITGGTANELRIAMLSTGPRLSDWPLFAYTEWEVKWRLRPQVPRGRIRTAYRRCRLEYSEVDLTIRTMLPRWSVSSEADRRLVEQWQTFLAALNVHENGHKDLGVQAARDVLHTLRTLRSLPCGSLVAEADTAARQSLNRFRQLNVEYDRVTTYGRTQGVHWPPGQSETPPPDVIMPLTKG